MRQSVVGVGVRFANYNGKYVSKIYHYFTGVQDIAIGDYVEVVARGQKKRAKVAAIYHHTPAYARSFVLGRCPKHKAKKKLYNPSKRNTGLRMLGSAK